MYCLPEPLEEAPEGEWACPAHRPGQRGKKKTETEMLELDKNKGTDPGMRHKPPRLDSKYQFRFSLDHPEEKNGEFMVSISGKDEIKVYLNGVRIHIDWKSDSNLKIKKLHSP